MDAETLLRSGDIAGARKTLAGELKRSPGDVNLRQFFWQLIAIAGEWDKAEQQLRALALAEPKAMMMGGVYNQVLSAMRTRDLVMAGTTRATSLVGSEPWVEGLLDALQAQASNAPGARDLAAAALDAAPATAGSMDGEPFEWIADADARFGPMLEAIVGDHYGFVPFAALKRIKFSEPVDLRDKVWLPAELETKSGQTSMAFIPVLYPGTQASGDAELMLGRRTEWIDNDGQDYGLGQRLITTDGPENGILGLRDVRLG